MQFSLTPSSKDLTAMNLLAPGSTGAESAGSNLDESVATVQAAGFAQVLADANAPVGSLPSSVSAAATTAAPNSVSGAVFSVFAPVEDPADEPAEADDFPTSTTTEASTGEVPAVLPVDLQSCVVAAQPPQQTSRGNDGTPTASTSDLGVAAGTTSEHSGRRNASGLTSRAATGRESRGLPPGHEVRAAVSPVFATAPCVASEAVKASAETPAAPTEPGKSARMIPGEVSSREHTALPQEMRGAQAPTTSSVRSVPPQAVPEASVRRMTNSAVETMPGEIGATGSGGAPAESTTNPLSGMKFANQIAGSSGAPGIPPGEATIETALPGTNQRPATVTETPEVRTTARPNRTSTTGIHFHSQSIASTVGERAEVEGDTEFPTTADKPSLTREPVLPRSRATLGAGVPRQLQTVAASLTAEQGNSVVQSGRPTQPMSAVLQTELPTNSTTPQRMAFAGAVSGAGAVPGVIAEDDSGVSAPVTYAPPELTAGSVRTVHQVARTEESRNPIAAASNADPQRTPEARPAPVAAAFSDTVVTTPAQASVRESSAAPVAVAMELGRPVEQRPVEAHSPSAPMQRPSTDVSALAPNPGSAANVEPTLRMPHAPLQAVQATPVLEATTRAVAALPVSGTKENSAAVPASTRAGLRNAPNAKVIRAVVTNAKQLTTSERDLGITSAKTQTTMPAGTTAAHPNATDSSVVSSVAPAFDVPRETQGLPQQVALTNTAHRAVEAVLNVTERFAARDQHSVSLQFSVGGCDLNVRVEMRSGEVHTTFRTDSADLCNALSTEWQNVISQNNDRPVRLAPPVFSSAEQPGTSFSGDGASKQRDHEYRGSAQPFVPSRSSGASSSDNAPAIAATATAPVRVSGKSRHLHTLA